MKKLPYSSLLTNLFVVLFAFAACQMRSTVNPGITESGKVKNVIYLIGDGMGPQQVGMLIYYAHYAGNSIYNGRQTALETVMEAGVLGYANNAATDVLVADSGSSASQLATGIMSGSEMIGLDRDGNRVETILEKASKMGKATGLVSDTRITHATPAAFAAHQTHRSKENEIAVDLVNAGVDVMLSGGLRQWIPREANDETSDLHKRLTNITGGRIKVESRREDSRNLLTEAEASGYELAFTKSQLEQARSQKILGLFASSALPDGIQETLTKNDPNWTIPTLKEMTVKALDVVSKNDNGFFLMVEAGQIDWACHDNDAGTLLHELLRFDETLQYIYNWVKNHDDTLLIVLADHETGGFGFSYSRRELPKPRALPGKVFEGEMFAPQYNFGTQDILDKLYNQKLSYDTMMNKFDALPEKQQTPGVLARIINASMEFKITEAEAATILEREENEYYVEGHKYLGSRTFPKVCDYKEFYVHGEAIRKTLIAKVVGKYQMTVWSNDTHTHTPVPVIAVGPKNITQKFGKMMHTTECAQYAIEALTQGQ